MRLPQRSRSGLAAAGLLLISLGAAGQGAALPGDIVDAAGAIVPSAYVAMAAQLGSEAGIAYRYGPDAASYGVRSAGLPSWHRRADVPARNGISHWQVGGPRNPGDATNDQAAAGSYSTNQANVLFVADDPAARIGVADIQVSGYEFNTFAQLPQLSWTNEGAPGGGIDSVNALGEKARGLLRGRPVAIGRCGGRAGFCAQGVVAYQDGLLATVGTNTARNAASTRLPPNKVPTAVAMTGNSEFALVTVWDTAALKGQVAVVALAGLCDGCRPGDTARYYDWWHEWMGVYPGLPNMGDIAFMKILGYVDLPGMAAPTEIAVSTGLDPFRTMLGNGNFMGLETPLTQQPHRESFLYGDNRARLAKGGVAVVISKSEQKVAFIDLRPLFDYMRSVYFEGDLATFNARMASLGQADGQWPYSFAHQPAQRPVPIQTVPLGARPTAVRTTLFGAPERAWIATQDGSLRIFDLGGYAGGAALGQIAQVGSVAVGRNPTSLAISKGEPGNDQVEPLNQQVLVASRGDRKIQWVRFTPDGNAGRVVRTLQDARIADPVAVEDADNFATRGYVLSIADHAGRAVSNFRYGPVVFADRGRAWACQPPAGCGMGPAGNAAFEFGGSMALPGRPFAISTANVP